MSRKPMFRVQKRGSQPRLVRRMLKIAGKISLTDVPIFSERPVFKGLQGFMVSMPGVRRLTSRLWYLSTFGGGFPKSKADDCCAQACDPHQADGSPESVPIFPERPGSQDLHPDSSIHPLVAAFSKSLSGASISPETWVHTKHRSPHTKHRKLLTKHRCF